MVYMYSKENETELNNAYYYLTEENIIDMIKGAEPERFTRKELKRFTRVEKINIYEKITGKKLEILLPQKKFFKKLEENKKMNKKPM